MWLSYCDYGFIWLQTKFPLEKENKVLFYGQYSNFLTSSNQSINKNWCVYVLLHSYIQRLKNGNLVHIKQPIFSRY